MESPKPSLLRQHQALLDASLIAKLDCINCLGFFQTFHNITHLKMTHHATYCRHQFQKEHIYIYICSYCGFICILYVLATFGFVLKFVIHNILIPKVLKPKLCTVWLFKCYFATKHHQFRTIMRHDCNYVGINIDMIDEDQHMKAKSTAIRH